MHRRHLIQAASAASLGWLTSRAHAQADTTLRLVVPYAPGGSSDRAARLATGALGGSALRRLLGHGLDGLGAWLSFVNAPRGRANALGAPSLSAEWRGCRAWRLW
mgnify:CR=1 FL=1